MDINKKQFNILTPGHEMVNNYHLAVETLPTSCLKIRIKIMVPNY